MMDEKTALTKWCPFDSNNIGTTIHYDSIPNASYCIGSKCMVWRWQWVIEDHPVPMGVNAHEIDSDGNWLGYCGLAGTP